MTHPLLYDIRRVFTSKTILVSMAALIGISLLLVTSFSISTTTTTQTYEFANTQVLSWYDTSGTYHFLAFATNQFGRPLSGVTFQANLTAIWNAQKIVTIATNSSNAPEYHGPSVSTNSSGEAEFVISVPVSEIDNVNDNYTVIVSVKEPIGYSNTTIGGYTKPYSTSSYVNDISETSPIPPGQVVSLSYNVIDQVTDTSNPQLSDIMVTWAGANGMLPTSYSLYYKFINMTETCTAIQGGQECSITSPDMQQLNESNMEFLSNMTAYQQIFAPPKPEANVSSPADLALSLFYPNGTAVSSFSMYYNTQSQQITTGEGNQIVMTFFQEIFGLAIPLIAIIGSYNSYGKDRTSGVLESVLAQPVSRRGLSLSRFVSSFVAMAIAIAISMGVVDVIVWYFTKSFVSSTIMLSSIGAFFAELAAFIGIMMLLSRVVKSSGALIGIGIGLFVVIDFFWSTLILIVLTITHTAYGSLAYYGYAVGAMFVNPAQLVGLVDTYLTHQVTMAGMSTFYFQITPSQYGITIPSLVVTGILWAVLPLAAFLYLAIKRD